MEPLVIVSADSHGGPRALDYTPYFDPKYRDQVQFHVRDIDVITTFLKSVMDYPMPAEDLELVDDRGVIRSGGEDGAFDPKRRLAEVEAEGVCAEIIHPGTQGYGPAPFFEIMCAKYTPEIRAAGARAYNRWLAEFCSAAPGRFIGSALIEPWPDMAAAVAELEWAKAAGLSVVWTDQFAGLEGEAPGLGDRYWDPFWAACVDLGIVVHIHIGFGCFPQGVIFDNLRRQTEEGAKNHDQGEVLEQFNFPSRRPLWQLMWGGVFDRHPKAKVAFAEQHAFWLPKTLELLERHFTNEKHHTMKLSPREYWQRNFGVVCTSVRPSDLAVRHEIGVDQMTFGTDYPHLEGTWPNTLDWLRATFADIPEDEARKILGENAIEFYGLDRALLEGVAARIGPRPDEVFGHKGDVGHDLIAHFDKRSGYLKPSKIDEEMLTSAVEEDARKALVGT